MNYIELQERVANQLVSSELIPFIPAAIEFAEAALNRDPRMRVRERLVNVYAVLSAGNARLALPDDYEEMRSVWLKAADYTNRLEFLTVERLQAWKLDRTTDGRPQYYAIFGTELEMLPVPSENYNLDILYYKRVPALTDGAPTNWLLDKHPDIYFYGTLLQATPYIHQEKRLPTWQAAYDAALEGLNVANERAEFSGGSLKMRAR